MLNPRVHPPHTNSKEVNKRIRDDPTADEHDISPTHLEASLHVFSIVEIDVMRSYSQEAVQAR